MPNGDDTEPRGGPLYNLVPVRGPEGEVLDGYRGVQRQDTNRVVSVVGKRYQLVQHRSIARAVGETIEKPDLTIESLRTNSRFRTESIKLYAGERRMEVKLVVGRKFRLDSANEIYPAVRVFNSLDGAWAVRSEVLGVRIACCNQLTRRGKGSGGVPRAPPLLPRGPAGADGAGNLRGPGPVRWGARHLQGRDGTPDAHPGFRACSGERWDAAPPRHDHGREPARVLWVHPLGGGPEMGSLPAGDLGDLAQGPGQSREGENAGAGGGRALLLTERSTLGGGEISPASGE
ncbi:MAG: DUF932 domain-containing protein [Nitrososphaerota archaeon]|nr:DUF932 domain-containing protein [Nitrososphaerota archaeon]